MSDRSARINIRLEAESLEKVRLAAKAAGLTISDYGRRCILGQPSPPHANYEAIRELRHLGLALRNLQADADPDMAAKLSPLLEEVKRAIHELGS